MDHESGVTVESPARSPIVETVREIIEAKAQYSDLPKNDELMLSYDEWGWKAECVNPVDCVSLGESEGVFTCGQQRWATPEGAMLDLLLRVKHNVRGPRAMVTPVKQAENKI